MCIYTVDIDMYIYIYVIHIYLAIVMCYLAISPGTDNRTSKSPWRIQHFLRNLTSSNAIDMRQLLLMDIPLVQHLKRPC